MQGLAFFVGCEGSGLLEFRVLRILIFKELRFSGLGLGAFTGSFKRCAIRVLKVCKGFEAL